MSQSSEDESLIERYEALKRLCKEHILANEVYKAEIKHLKSTLIKISKEKNLLLDEILHCQTKYTQSSVPRKSRTDISDNKRKAKTMETARDNKRAKTNLSQSCNVSTPADNRSPINAFPLDERNESELNEEDMDDATNGKLCEDSHKEDIEDYSPPPTSSTFSVPNRMQPRKVFSSRPSSSPQRLTNIRSPSQFTLSPNTTDPNASLRAASYNHPVMRSTISEWEVGRGSPSMLPSSANSLPSSRRQVPQISLSAVSREVPRKSIVSTASQRLPTSNILARSRLPVSAATPTISSNSMYQFGTGLSQSQSTSSIQRLTSSVPLAPGSTQRIYIQSNSLSTRTPFLNEYHTSE